MFAMSSLAARSAASRTAAGSITRRKSCRSRKNSGVSPTRDRHMITSRSNQFQRCDGSTLVSTFELLVIKPFAASDFTESRMTVRLTPSSTHTIGSGGIAAPTGLQTLIIAKVYMPNGLPCTFLIMREQLTSKMNAVEFCDANLNPMMI